MQMILKQPADIDFNAEGLDNVQPRVNVTIAVFDSDDPLLQVMCETDWISSDTSNPLHHFQKTFSLQKEIHDLQECQLNSENLEGDFYGVSK